MSEIKIALGGYGRMGRIAENYFASDLDVEIVYGVTRTPPARGQHQFPIYYPDALRSDLPSVDIWLDFSRAEGTLQNIPLVVGRGIKPVIGTTGFSPEQQQQLRKVLEESGLPCFWDSNFSLGVNVMAYLVELGTRALQGYDVEVAERHHNKKRDGASGTAENILLTAVVKAREQQAIGMYRSQIKDHLRKPQEVGLSYQRAGDNPGRHEVVFGGNREELVISHQTFDPVVFVGGAKRAMLWLYGQQTSGVYSFRNLLGL